MLLLSAYRLTIIKCVEKTQVAYESRAQFYKFIWRCLDYTPLHVNTHKLYTLFMNYKELMDAKSEKVSWIDYAGLI